MVGVAVALVVAGDNVDEDPIFLVGVQVLEAATDRWEHSPVERRDENEKTCLG